MPQPDFPHLPLVYHGRHQARLHGGGQTDPRVAANRTNRASHASALRRRLAHVRRQWRKEQKKRAAEGLPLMGDRMVIGLQMPAHQLDLTFLEKQFGLELISESDDGLLLVGSQDLNFPVLMQAIRHFARGEKGGGSTAGILEVYGPDDDARLNEVLDEELRSQWPFKNDELMTLDVIIEVPHHPGYVRRERSRGPKGEDPAAKSVRIAALTSEATQQAAIIWDEQRDIRVQELEEFIRDNGGEILNEIADSPEEEDGIVSFPDSVLVRARMGGRGFRDLVLSIPWLVRLEGPDHVERWEETDDGAFNQWEVSPPSPDAPRVCVIDSGIQEEHRLLAAAILTTDSRCYLPGKGSGETQDEVQPSGHGTKVAGAVLHPELGKTASVLEPVAWLQNARVLNAENKFEANQNPLRNFQDIVEVMVSKDVPTRLYVHSINGDNACRTRRMTAWPALLDTHSHQNEILIFQSAGNVARNCPVPARLGVRQHLASERGYPDYLLENACRLAAPAQSFHAITVGSVTASEWKGTHAESIADGPHRPSAFSRTGLGLWGSVKPDVVEVGGDYQRTEAGDVRVCLETAPMLVQSTLHGARATGRDGGTSFAAPKVAHIGATLQRLFPDASAQLYRALIINSARWPQWAENLPEAERIDALRMIGYGLPNLQRATENTSTRITLITADAQEITNGKAMVYSIPVPLELRDSTTPCRVRIDVSLCYTAEPRQTRATRYGYLETWLSWMASKLEEPLSSFLNRATKTAEKGGSYTELPWMLRERSDRGGIDGAARQNGTAQKDWAVVRNVELPNEFAIAVQAHKGWNREDQGGYARFALVVSFEALDAEIPVYSRIQTEIEERVEQEIQPRTT